MTPVCRSPQPCRAPIIAPGSRLVRVHKVVDSTQVSQRFLVRCCIRPGAHSADASLAEATRREQDTHSAGALHGSCRSWNEGLKDNRRCVVNVLCQRCPHVSKFWFPSVAKGEDKIENVAKLQQYVNTGSGRAGIKP